MLSSLQRLSVSFPLSIASLGVLSAISTLQPSRSILAFLFSYLFPLVCLWFGYLFVTAFIRLMSFRRHSIIRFALPILAALLLLVCSVWLATRIGVLVHRFV